MANLLKFNARFNLKFNNCWSNLVETTYLQLSAPKSDAQDLFLKALIRLSSDSSSAMRDPLALSKIVSNQLKDCDQFVLQYECLVAIEGLKLVPLAVPAVKMMMKGIEELNTTSSVCSPNSADLVCFFLFLL